MPGRPDLAFRTEGRPRAPRPAPIAALADLGRNRLVALDREDDGPDPREPRRGGQAVVIFVSRLRESSS